MIKRYQMSNGNLRLSEHFSLHEFQSQNGYDVILIDTDLIDILENIYSHFNCSRAIIIDGYRQPGEYNLTISGMYTDTHTYGMAADVAFYDKDFIIIDGKRICCYAQDINVQGIGYNGNSTHLDTRGNGGYKNSHWWGDETNGNTVTDWYDYWGFDKDNNSEIIKEMRSNMTRQEKENYVNCAFIELLGRMADADGLNNYCAAIPDNAGWYDDLTAYVDSPIRRSAEYSQYQKRLYIEKVFNILLNRNADENGLNTYMQYATYRDIYRDIFNSAEAANIRR